MNRTLQKMAITISPPLRNMRAESLYREDMYAIQRSLNKVSRHYCLYPDFDEKSRLHYHGFIIIHDMIKWHKRIKREIDMTIGFVSLKPIKSHNDALGWLCYCKKIGFTYPPIIYRKLKRTNYVKKEDIDEGISKYFRKPRG